MFRNPHVTCGFAIPSATLGGNESIRLGRAGGIQAGTWWELATRTVSKFHICIEATAATRIFIDTAGNVGNGTRTP